MTAFQLPISPDPAIAIESVEGRAAVLSMALAEASPEAVMAAAVQAVRPGRLAVVSSFGVESAVLLAAAAAVHPAIPVLLLDTGHLFPETLAYRDTLQTRLGLRDVRAMQPDAQERDAQDPDAELYASDADACCALRKVRPLARALQEFDGWANGRKRFQGGLRTAIPFVEADGPRLKFNPLAALSPGELAARFRALDLPPHPLAKYGFRSIGCMPCSSRSAPGEAAREGRWRGSGKVECGIHFSAAKG